MRKIINSTYVSLDGVIGWIPEIGEEKQQYASDLLFSCDTLLMGRKTYEKLRADMAEHGGVPRGVRRPDEHSAQIRDLVDPGPSGVERQTPPPVSPIHRRGRRTARSVVRIREARLSVLINCAHAIRP